MPFRRSSVLLVLAFLGAAPLASQQTGTVRGHVTNQDTGAPLSGALVALRGTAIRATTGENGIFVLSNVPAGEYTLVATYIGFTPGTSPVQAIAGQTTEHDIALKATAVNLREVVVTATKTETEVRDVPAAVSVVSSEKLAQRGVTNFTEAVKTAPGVSVGSFGENFNSVQLRGLPRFGNENEAVLILLDGVPQTDARNSAQDQGVLQQV